MKNMTYHAQAERFDRIAYIIDNIGLGEEMYRNSKDEVSYTILTTTGIIIVKNINTHKVVTVFAASIDQATAIIKKSTGRHKIPDGLYKRILNNQKIMKKFK